MARNTRASGKKANLTSQLHGPMHIAGSSKVNILSLLICARPRNPEIPSRFNSPLVENTCSCIYKYLYRYVSIYVILDVSECVYQSVFSYIYIYLATHGIHAWIKFCLYSISYSICLFYRLKMKWRFLVSFAVTITNKHSKNEPIKIKIKNN